MRTRTLAIVSLILNGLLAAGLIYFVAGRERSDSEVAAAPEAEIEPATNNIRTNVVVRRQFFTWREIESPDYPTYIANLRSIDVPEATIRDIIVSEVNQLFARRTAAEMASADFQWWRTDAGSGLPPASLERLQALDQERRDLLTQLLGPNWDTSASAAAEAIQLTGPVLGELPAETKDQVRFLAILNQQRQQAYINAQLLAGLPVDPAQLARIRAETREELARVLNPEQLEEYLLRYSQNAVLMRGDLALFNATPDEFRRMFRILDPINLQIELLCGGNDPASIKKRQELEQQREAALLQNLGPERYRLYALSRDPEFRSVHDAVQKLNVPVEMVVPLYEIDTATRTERQRILANPSLSTEQQAVAIQAMLLEKELSLRTLLGPERYEIYRASRPQ